MTLEVPIPTIRERPATHNGLWKCSSCKKPNPKSENLHLQEWASEHSSAPLSSIQAPELWDCPSHADIDESTRICSLGRSLFTIV